LQKNIKNSFRIGNLSTDREFLTGILKTAKKINYELDYLHGTIYLQNKIQAS